jgi:hypothetical protein
VSRPLTNASVSVVGKVDSRLHKSEIRVPKAIDPISTVSVTFQRIPQEHSCRKR